MLDLLLVGIKVLTALAVAGSIVLAVAILLVGSGPGRR